MLSSEGSHEREIVDEVDPVTERFCGVDGGVVSGLYTTIGTLGDVPTLDAASYALAKIVSLPLGSDAVFHTHAYGALVSVCVSAPLK